MTGVTKWLLLLFALLVSPFFGRESNAQTITAGSCSNSAIQTALNSVTADGTTVIIPEGACSWTQKITYNQVYSTTIQGQSTTTGTCAPGGTCTTTDNTLITDSVSGTALLVITAAGKSFRLTGLTFSVPSTGTPAYGALTIKGNSTSVRIDHNHINDALAGDHTFQIDNINGVGDHNYFDSTTASDTFFIQQTVYGSDGNANATWTIPENFGTSQFFFWENNLFQNGHFAFDCDFGGRVVFRYNTTGTNTALQTHAVGSGQQIRGCRALEIYNNSFTFSGSPNTNSFAFLEDYESGNGMWWGNTITGFTTFLREDTVRTNSATYPQTSTPNGYGYCGTSLGPSNWDGNNNSAGYPCLDQLGRGAGDLLTGNFPNLVNSITGTISWPHQAIVPVYAWNNTLNTNSYAPNHYWSNLDSATVENRDYYLQIPNTDESATFNGTAGIGQGLAAAKPATCTPLVGWWGTDTQTLYVCTATNTWTPYYAPYTYPHPLTAGTQSSGAPAAPTNVSALVN